MLEDACLLNDASFLPTLFDVDAVLLAPRDKPGTRTPRDSQCDHRALRMAAATSLPRDLVLQSGPLALIISANATSVARRNLDGWHYVISQLDL